MKDLRDLKDLLPLKEGGEACLLIRKHDACMAAGRVGNKGRLTLASLRASPPPQQPITSCIYCSVEGLGFSFLGFWVLGFGCRVQGSGFRVWRLVFVVEGLRFRV